MSAASVKDLRSKVAQQLSDFKVDELPEAEKDVVTIPSDVSLPDAFQILLDAGIQSAPVEQKKGNGYAGVLDIRALVSSVVSIHKNQGKRAELGDLVADLQDSGDHMKVWTPEYVARINPLKTVDQSAAILDVCKILSKGTRRVAVISEGKVVRVISQSWLTGVLSRVVRDNAGSITVTDLGISPKDVFVIKTSEPVLKAFEFMDEHGISGVPVITEEGRLVGQVTSRDLHRFLKDRDANTVETPVSEFMGEELSEDIGDAISIQAKTTAVELFEAFAITRSHRMFLVKGTSVVGVVSLKDALACMLESEQ